MTEAHDQADFSAGDVGKLFLDTELGTIFLVTTVDGGDAEVVYYDDSTPAQVFIGKRERRRQPSFRPLQTPGEDASPRRLDESRMAILRQEAHREGSA